MQTLADILNSEIKMILNIRYVKYSTKFCSLSVSSIHRYSAISLHLLLFYSFLKISLMWTILKVFITFVTVLLVSYSVFFQRRGLWGLSSLPGLEPALLALKGNILTPAPPGTPHCYLNSYSYNNMRISYYNDLFLQMRKLMLAKVVNFPLV